MNRWRKNRTRGFTLVELMIVIVIMVILATMAVPAFSGYLKKARSARYLSACRAVYTAVEAGLELQEAVWQGPGSMKIPDIDQEALEDEVEELSEYRAEFLDSENEIPAGEYGYYLEEDRESGELYCRTVIYNGQDEGVWKFDTEDGTFAELAEEKGPAAGK